MLSEKLPGKEINDLLYKVKNNLEINSMQLMQTKAEKLLNSKGYSLSKEARKRLRWLYVLYYECESNVSQAANKISISREWLSKIKSVFEKNDRNPLSLEPESRAPHHASKRKRISREIEDKIIFVRDNLPGWGEKKIECILLRDYEIKVSKNTVNRYLHKHGKIDPKISGKNKRAWQDKLEREKQKDISLKIKYRPPTKIKDYLPGALIEKDMKLVPKIEGFRLTVKQGEKYHLKDRFYYQHSFIDSFTRIRATELVKQPSSEQAKSAYQKIRKRMPFDFACFNTDNGSENAKDFSEKLEKDNLVHFYSKTSTPTDNPRVERSHLTDEKEFYQRGNICQGFEKQKERNKNWEYTYNYVRPHQALGYLTPMEFYQLWKDNSNLAYAITKKYQAYLKRQRIRLANSRRMRRRKQIDKLMLFIDNKLRQKVGLKFKKKVCEFKLVKCELCSWG